MTAQDIISEALELNMQNECKDTSILGRLFSPTFQPSESKIKSSVILYLSNRLEKEMEEKQKAVGREHMAYRKAKKCVEIYGTEALIKFEEMWNK